MGFTTFCFPRFFFFSRLDRAMNRYSRVAVFQFCMEAANTPPHGSEEGGKEGGDA